MQPQLPTPSSLDDDSATLPALSRHSWLSRLRAAAKQRSRTLFGAIFFLGCVLGIMLGVFGSFLYVALASDKPLPVTAPTFGSPAVFVKVTSQHFAQIAQQKASNVQVPGTLQSIQAKMQRNQPIMLTGDDQISLLGFPVTRRFTVRMQPYVNACRLQMRVLHVDLAGVPMPAVANSMEQQLNQQPLLDSSALSKKFVYCVTEAHTEDDGLYLTLTAQPVRA